MLTFEQLVEGFRDLGVHEGDTLLVHSSYKSLGEVDGGPETVIRALRRSLSTWRRTGSNYSRAPFGMWRPCR